MLSILSLKNLSPLYTGKTMLINSFITNSNLNIRISGNAEVQDGEAVVSSQSPPSGTLVPKGTVVTVEFKYINVH